MCALALLACGRSPEKALSERPPIILISIDTLRSDHLPAYGYRGVETPNIDALRRDSILYTSAWSHVPLTLPSHVSILTGLLPPQNGVRNNLGYRFDATAHRPVTLALKDRGYDTGAAVSAYVLRGDTGLKDAFDFYEDSIGKRSGVMLADLQRPGSATEEIAEIWLSSHREKPFFFMLHLFEPHAPYEPPAKFAHYANPYDGEIAADDEIVGRFFEFLKKSGTYDRALVILLSDHGEGLNDHGEQEHGILLYREAIQVPLMIKLPHSERRGTTVTSPVELIDVAPTIASAAGVEWHSDGASLIATAPAQRNIYSETFYPRIHLGWSELRSMTDGKSHYIEAVHPEFYDLASDPGEKRNVIEDQRRVFAAMKQELARIDSKLAQPSQVSREEAAKLTALGYIGSTANVSSGPLPDPKDEIGKLQPLQDAARLSAEGKRDQAIRAYRKFLETNPRMVAAWSGLASDLEATGRVEEAAAAYSDAIRHVPEMAANFALPRGSLLLRLGRFDEAQHAADMATGVNPGAAHHLLARIALARRDVGTAEREARAAMEDSSYRLQATVTLAQIFSAGGRRDEALALLDHSLRESQAKRTPVEFLQFARGDLLMMLGRRDEAAGAFRAEIAAFPAHLRAYGNLAAILFLERRNDEARAVLNQMAEANPTRDAYALGAKLYGTFGDSSAAAEWQARARSAAAR